MHTAQDPTHDSGELPRHVDTTEPARDNSGYFPPGYQEKAEKLIQASHGAAADPLPGPLLEAFLPEQLRAAGYELRPVVPTDFAILRRINSPILQEMMNASMNKDLPKPEVKYTDEDIWELIYLWTRPTRDARAVLARGREVFLETAMAAADKLPMSVLAEKPAIIQALAANVMRAFATRLNHQPASSGEGGENFPSGHRLTASAGGSTT